MGKSNVQVERWASRVVQYGQPLVDFRPFIAFIKSKLSQKRQGSG